MFVELRQPFPAQKLYTLDNSIVLLAREHRDRYVCMCASRYMIKPRLRARFLHDVVEAAVRSAESLDGGNRILVYR